MLNVVEPLARRLLPRLSQDSPRSAGIRSWLEEGSFFVEAGPRPADVLLKNVGMSELVPYINFDYERFSLASLESYLFASDSLRNNRALAWPVLKSYYAAFFGAHSIMRGVGDGVVRVDPSNARAIAEIARTYQVNTQLTAGTFGFRLQQNADKTIDVALIRMDERGGAHESFWKAFYAFLTRLGEEVVAGGEPDANLTIAEISQLQVTLRANGMNSGTWLSSIRNQINYRQDFGVWFPYNKSHSAHSLLARIPLNAGGPLRMDLDTSKNTIDAFVACCLNICLVSAELSKALCRRAGTKRLSRLNTRLLEESV